MLSNLSLQQLNDFIQMQPNPTVLQLQLLTQGNSQLEKEMQYSCYLSGIKKYFKATGLSVKEYAKVEKLLDQSDSKRVDVRRFNVKYTRDQPLGYKLQKMGSIGGAQSPLFGSTVSVNNSIDSVKRSPRSPRKVAIQVRASKDSIETRNSCLSNPSKSLREESDRLFFKKVDKKRP